MMNSSLVKYSHKLMILLIEEKAVHPHLTLGFKSLFHF